MSRRLYRTEPGSVAIAYSDIPSLHLRDQLAKRTEQHGDRPGRAVGRQPGGRRIQFSGTTDRVPSCSIYSKEWRQQVRRSTSLHSLAEESEDGVSTDTTSVHEVPDRRIFVHTEITISEPFELDVPAKERMFPCRTAYVSGPDVESARHPHILKRSASRPTLGIPLTRSDSGFYSVPPSSSPSSPSASSCQPENSQSTSDGDSLDWMTTSSSSAPSSPPLTGLPVSRPSSGSDKSNGKPSGKLPKSDSRRSFRMRLRIPDFLRPLDEPQAPIRIYDVPLRRNLFSKAQPGNEHTLTTSSNDARVAEAVWSQQAMEKVDRANLLRSNSCPVLPPFRESLVRVRSREDGAEDEMGTEMEIGGGGGGGGSAARSNDGVTGRRTGSGSSSEG
ncbi:hypothetical protein LTR46_000783 [Exophiala xenobiotica]|nr:hypothetical protein LTR46_000783 [Exophiala xenobiotica]